MKQATVLPKLAAPAQRALASASISTLKQLAKHTEAEIAALHGMGSNALGKLKEAMKEQGFFRCRIGDSF